MKVMHWPFAGLLLIVFSSSAIILMIIAYISAQMNASVARDKVINTVGMLAGFCILISLLFYAQHWPHVDVLIMLGKVLGPVFIVLHLVRLYKKKEMGQLATLSIALTVGALLCAIGFNDRSFFYNEAAFQSIRTSDIAMEQLLNQIEILEDSDTILQEDDDRLAVLDEGLDLIFYLDSLQIVLIAENEQIKYQDAAIFDLALSKHAGDNFTATRVLIEDNQNSSSGTWTASEMLDRLDAFAKNASPYLPDNKGAIHEIREPNQQNYGLASLEISSYFGMPFVSAYASLAELKLVVAADCLSAITSPVKT